ncbi:MAG TPA: DUF4070 domain-containing protein, partial [Acidobacteriota bacterium]|nr:DUF4070 domain-containing protein [Acidobacteriota bacterium]
RRRGKRVVAGGPAFTTGHAEFDGVDHFVLGEAEQTLPAFLRDLAAGCPQPVYVADGFPDIAQTPVPDWQLLNFRHYATMAVQYSRGCPFDCEFCDIIVMNGRVPRTKTPAQVLRELDALYAAGGRGALFFVDDNFIGNKARVKELLPEIIRWQKAHDYPFRLFTEASLNLADDPELLSLMSAANFFRVFLGIETPCADSLRECGKMHNVGRNMGESVRIIQQHGLQVMGGFIVGFDHDPDTIFESQIRFIQQVGIVTAMVSVLTALPQTRLWHRLKAEGRLLSAASGENTDGSLNFVPRMDRERLLEGYRRIITTLYAPRNYYRRIHTFLKTYRPTVRGKPSWSDFKALFRSMWRIGVFSRSCLLYWRLIIGTALTRFRAFPIAVEMAIYGLHFQRVARRTARPPSTRV